MPARKKLGKSGAPILDYQPPPPPEPGLVHSIIRSEWGCILVIGGMALAMFVVATVRSRTFGAYVLIAASAAVIMIGVVRVVGRMMK